MQRYFEEVQQVDRGEMSPREFTEAIFGLVEWAAVWAAARIYIEDGGTRYTPQEFIDACGVEEPPEVRGMFQEFFATSI